MATTKIKKNTKEIVTDTKKGKTHPLIISPRVTEKSANASLQNAYTFNVKPEANKSEVMKAINFVYGVKPLKVSITQITKKVIFRKGKMGVKQGGKKAVVYLKKGDKITFA